jgi:predicted translin family RNA/ssDNA-binding protein
VRQFNDVLPQDVAAELSTRKQEILKTFESISADTTGINRWRYERQISGGVQEFIEALSFEHYLTRQTLVTPDEASQALAGHIPLTADDYVLGIFDLVGELMRFCITQIATSGELPKLPEPRSVLTDLRALRAYFEMLNTRNASAGGFLAKDVDKKMEVMKTSVEKVEHATYGIILRGRERPKGWVPPMESDMGNALSGETYA